MGPYKKYKMIKNQNKIDKNININIAFIERILKYQHIIIYVNCKYL